METKQLGPYIIGRQLGRGGMGTVYAAVETATGKKAAVKVLAPILATQEGFRERFEAEIDSLKQLQHPNIVQLFGYGQQDANLFYSMELVEGLSLEDELVQGRRFDWREVCHIGIDLCRALKLAHDHGIIHRDIKPGNLLWTADGSVKLTDFGIARLFGNTGLTSDGGVLGTAEYMAPEQADGRRVTQHCDLYSLGGVMYALLAGGPPFRSKSMLEMLQMQRYTKPEPVRRFAPDTPMEMESIIGQLLEKEPKDRFPNALMVARRLEAMERALTLRANQDVGPPTGNQAPSDGFEIGRRSDGPQDDAPLLNVTAVADESMDQIRATKVDQDAEDVGHLMATGDGGFENGEQPADVLAGIKTNHFTTVEEARREAESYRNDDNPLISATTWALIAGLIMISVTIWYLVQPPSAESLYAKISAAAKYDDVELLEVEFEVAEFLKHYPDEKRSDEVRGYQRQITALTETGAEKRAEKMKRAYPDSPIASEYLVAIRLAENEPEEAAARLQAMVELYGATRDQPREVRLFVDEARRNLPRIQHRIHQRAFQQLPKLEENFQRAFDFRNTHPKKSKVICRAIVQLYEDKPWAAVNVAKAKALLVELEKQTTVAPPAG